MYVENELNRLVELPQGWDGRHAAQITNEAVQTTVDLLPAISDEQSVPPQFFPLPDGGIQFEWHVGGNDIEIEVDGGGEAHAVAVTADDNILFEGEIAIDQTRSLFAIRHLVRSWSAYAARTR